MCQARLQPSLAHRCSHPGLACEGHTRLYLYLKLQKNKYQARLQPSIAQSCPHPGLACAGLLPIPPLYTWMQIYQAVPLLFCALAHPGCLPSSETQFHPSVATTMRFNIAIPIKLYRMNHCDVFCRKK